MINYPRWKILLIGFILLFGIANAVPNLVGKDGRLWVVNNLPSFVPSQSINLGLDLQGGAYILLDVDFDTVFAERMEGVADTIRLALREDAIRAQSINASKDSVVITAKGNGEEIRKVIRNVDPNFVIDIQGNESVITLNEAVKQDVVNQTLSQTIEIIRRRVDETGTNEPIIQRQGDRRVLVQLPGIDNPNRVKNLLGKTAKLGFHLTDERATRTGRGGASALVLPMMENPAQELGVKRRAMITGEMLTNASTQFGEGGMPVVSFQLDGRGADRFCRLSRDNVGQPFAIVLDNEGRCFASAIDNCRGKIRWSKSWCRFCSGW
jgi:preprotein translocase subunit SecD